MEMKFGNWVLSAAFPGEMKIYQLRKAWQEEHRKYRVQSTEYGVGSPPYRVKNCKEVAGRRSEGWRASALRSKLEKGEK
jgi:hypothetical protein